MINTQLVFQAEYRLDLKPLKSVLIPYVFNEPELIISIEALSPGRSYRSSGRIEEILVDSPVRTALSSHITRFNGQAIELANKGKYKLDFFPNQQLGRTKLSIYKMFFTSDPNGHPGFLSNHYYAFDPSIQNYTSLISNGFIANTLTYIPWFVPQDVFINKLAIYISGSNLNSKVRLGIYNNLDGYPSKLILDAGELDTSAVGFKELNIDLELKAGWYWLAGNSTIAPTIYVVSTHFGSQFLIGIKNLILSNFSSVYRQANVNYGVMPQEAITSNIVRGNYAPVFWFQVK